MIMRLIFQKIRSYLNEKMEFNYFYFGLLLASLTFFTLSHFLLLENTASGAYIFFLFYAFIQSFFEICTFILIFHFLKKWAPKWLSLLFISFCFLALLLHFTNFIMLRLMDISLAYPLKFLFGSGVEHFIVGLQALNMNMGMMALIFLTFLLIPFCGVLLYWGTRHAIRKKPWSLSINQLGLTLLLTGSSLLGFDSLARPHIDRMTYRKYEKALPLSSTFLSPSPEWTALPHPLTPPCLETKIQEQIASIHASSKPNIYLFIVESFRKDFITQEIAPHLNQFEKENIQIPLSFSNANATQPSWFAIFYGAFPLHWTSARDTWNSGAPSLQILKHLGYKIRVYSSADLRYFGMDRVLFGQNRHLADQIEEFSFDRSLEPCDRDALCIHSFERDLKKEGGKEGNVYVFFFDSTHSEYSFPKDFPIQFNPIVKQIDYLTVTKKKIEPIKNRYRNSIHYVDSLMGTFFHLLKEESLYENSVIAITGDHGEEFFEEGSLFHGTHLNRYQTAVPIFLKCQGRTSQTQEATHIDIFPSLLHHLTDQAYFGDFFDGTSVFSKKRSPYRLAVMQNGAEVPYEFSIYKGENELHLRLFPQKDIYSSTQMEIISQQIGGESIDSYLSLISQSAKESLEKTTD